MEVRIEAHLLELDKGSRAYVLEKIGSLQKFVSSLKTPVEARVFLSRTRRHKTGKVFQVIVNIALPGKLIRAKEEGQDLFLTIDRARDQLQRELKKYQEKFRSQARQRVRNLKLRRLSKGYRGY